MTNNEKKFWDILTNLFVGAEVKGKSGFINLMKSKQTYFKKVQKELLNEINGVCKTNQDFKDELYDKLYSFFHRYFSESGSIYYNYTPLFYNIYTKAYEEQNISEIKAFTTDYERVISDRQDTSLFYKTQMLYYVKSDKIFKDLEIEIEGKKFAFDVSNMEGKKANEKKELVYTLESIENKRVDFSVAYSVKGKKTKTKDILIEIKKEEIDIKEDDLKKAFRIFEKQSNIDYFINKDANKFLTEQLDMWIYQYMFSQEIDLDLDRFNQIQDFKKISLKLVNFISQFENELVKIWNKPRFVLNSNIVVTMDLLISKGFDIEKLKKHKNYNLQQKEWKELELSTGDGLIENEYLPIDTKYFPELKDEIEELFNEDEINGLLIKSENYQALNTILPRFKNKVDLIYIDPPFNTGDDFDYLDRFQDSTWLSLMENRLFLSKDLLSKKGSFYLHLGENAGYLGRFLMDKFFGEDNYLNNIVWHFNIIGGNAKKFERNHEYITWYAKDSSNYIFNKDDARQPYSEKFLASCKVDENGNYYYSRGSGRDGEKLNRKKESMVNPLGKAPSDVWDDISYMPSGKERQGFATQKTEKLMNRIIQASSNINSMVLDYHSGSGSTVVTAQKLNRKWIGIEMGEHFHTVVIPRMKKVIGGFECGISKNSNYKGSGVFKYYELEQYEQILRSTKYSDTPFDFIESKKFDEIKDCFLFDEKLTKVIESDSENFKVDLSKLYENIDLKETIHNLTGKRPKEIKDNKVIFEDKEVELLEILKPLLVW